MTGSVVKAATALVRGDRKADRIVPPSGHSATLTLMTSGAMAFLAVFALALSLAAGRLADRWATELAQSSTVRISAPRGQMDAQTAAAVAVLKTTPGIASVRVLGVEEQQALLAPWFGPDFPVESLPVPQLIDVVEENPGYDADGLRFRLAAEAPGAILDDHSRWRKPLVSAAARLRMLGFVSILLIALATGAMITLAASASLAANAQVIRVLRLVGARDVYIARAFVRRFTLRALSGAGIGMVAGMIGVSILPDASAAGSVLTGLGFSGWGWLWPLTIPVFAAFVALWSTRAAALRSLRNLT
jgi:cell division transport system permease protein